MNLQDLGTPLGRYGCMVLIRRFEEKIGHLFSEGLIGGTSHLCIGQEACAVGAVSALGAGDGVVSSHRGHGHYLAKGGDVGALMAELLGKASGVCRGRGGSQHLYAPEHGFYGTNGITGGGLPVATGVALAGKMRETGGVTACFFGDGATNQGTFHESLNLASIWRLPIVYVCENNLYAMSTPVAEAMAVRHVADRASAYAMPGVTVDGMDAEAVREAVGEAAARARGGEGPTLVEALCYRFCGHSKSDRLVYRTDEEEAAWRERDPLKVAREALGAAGTAEAALAAVEAAAEAAVEAAYAWAKAEPDPSAEEVLVSPYPPGGGKGGGEG
jgi:TPP-dependent pyruvate/acetoin dehydrogenase alpha subunit